jgi:hypothetical protein
MTQHFQDRIGYACHKGRIALPPDQCGPTWTNAVRYFQARWQARKRTPTDSGCGNEHTVYATLIRQDFWGLGPPPDPGHTLTVFGGSTASTFSDTSFPGTELREALWTLRASTIRDYWSRNTTPFPADSVVAGTSAVAAPGALMDSARQASGHGSDPLKIFYRTFPRARGVIHVSRPGIDPGQSQALIELGWTKGPLHGRGFLLFLECRRQHWQLADSAFAWAS